MDDSVENRGGTDQIDFGAHDITDRDDQSRVGAVTGCECRGIEGNFGPGGEMIGEKHPLGLDMHPGLIGTIGIPGRGLGGDQMSERTQFETEMVWTGHPPPTLIQFVEPDLDIGVGDSSRDGAATATVAGTKHAFIWRCAPQEDPLELDCCVGRGELGQCRDVGDPFGEIRSRFFEQQPAA